MTVAVRACTASLPACRCLQPEKHHGPSAARASSSYLPYCGEAEAEPFKLLPCQAPEAASHQAASGTPFFVQNLPILPSDSSDYLQLTKTQRGVFPIDRSDNDYRIIKKILKAFDGASIQAVRKDKDVSH